jgi:serine protease
MFTKDVVVGLPGGTGPINEPMAGNNMTWHGGPVQHTPKIYVIYWGWNGSDPSGVAARVQSFYGGTGGSQWQSSQTQYTDGSGHVGNQTGELVTTWSDNTNKLPSRITQSTLAAEAVRAIAHFGSGSYSTSTNYIVASPHGKSMSGFGTQWCAWHSSTSSSYGTVSYTYLPYMPDAGASCGANSVNRSGGTLDGVTIVGGHEQAETMTDPQPSSGWIDSSGAETGDKCAWTNLQNTPFSTGTFPTQPLWSNSPSGCVQ